MAKPTSTPDWINDDDPTKITEPSGSKQLEGWQSGEKPPSQYFNWFWNLISKWIQWFDEVTSQYNIIIDSTANHGDYLTLAAYLADAPAAGDRVMINLDETVTEKLTIPVGIKLKLQKGKAFLCSADIAGILEFGDDCETEGDILIELSHTGTITTAVSVNGDNNHHCNIVLNNTSTGTVTTGFKIESGKAGNTLTGEIINPGGTVTTPLSDASGLLSNYSSVRDTDSDIIHLGVDLPIVSGGTGAGTAGDARTNLGLGTIAVLNSPLPIANGGTAASDASTARSNLGLGTIATQDSTNVNVSGGAITGITDLAVADGGTDASDVATAQTNLGLDGVIFGDAIAGRVMRCSTLKMGDGTTGTSIKLQLTGSSEAGDWNGDSAALVDDIVVGGDSTNYNLSGDGQIIIVKAAAFSGNVIAVLGAYVFYDENNFVIGSKALMAGLSSGGIFFKLWHGTGYTNWTSIGSGDNLMIHIQYLSSE